MINSSKKIGDVEWSMFVKDMDHECVASPSQKFIVEPKTHGISVIPKGYSDQDGGHGSLGTSLIIYGPTN